MSKEVIVNNTQGGVSGLSLLGLLFVGLKLTGYIQWSWWWVLAPFWVPLAIFLVVLVIGLGGYLLYDWWGK